MYTTVNAPVVQTLFINLEHVHECRQIDKIKHGLEHFTSKQNPSHMWKGNPMTSGPTFLLPHFRVCYSNSPPLCASILQYLEKVPLFPPPPPQFIILPVTNFHGQAAFAQKFGKKNTQQYVKSRQFFQTKWQENSCFTGLCNWIAIPVHGAESRKHCIKLHANNLCAVKITTVMYQSILPSDSMSAYPREANQTKKVQLSPICEQVSKTNSQQCHKHVLKHPNLPAMR